MSLTNGQMPDETTLIRYLVGKTSDEDTERFDELSVADDEFVAQLRAVEHDLVDAYVSGALSGEALADFEAQYLRSAAGLTKVELARALQRRAAIAQIAGTAATNTRATSLGIPWWGLAAAAVLALAAIAYFAVDSLRLRHQMNALLAQYEELEQRQQELGKELDRERSASTDTMDVIDRLREQLAEARERAGDTSPAAVIALFLSPVTRSASDVKAVTISEGTETIVLRLQAIVPGFSQYQAVVKESGGDRVAWRTGRLPPPSGRQQGVLSIRVPADRLEVREYIVELGGLASNGQVEPLDTYAFRVAAKSR